MQVVPRAHWLFACLGAGGRKAWSAAITNFLSECVAASHSSDDPGKASSQGDPEDEGVETPEKRGRKRVLDSDDEAEVGAASGGSGLRAKTKPLSPCRPHRRAEFVHAEVRGMDLTFMVTAGPKVFVPVDGPWLPMIVKHLVGRTGEDKQKQYGDHNFGS